MPNLLDVIELATPKKTKVEAAFTDVLTDASAAYKFLTSIGARAGEKELLEKVGVHLQGLRKQAFTESLTLPTALRLKVTVAPAQGGGVTTANNSYYKEADSLGRLAGRAQSKLSRLRNTADMLGMVIMPYAALDARSLKSEGYDIRQKVTQFLADAQEAALDVYVIAPLRLYSVEQHVAMTEGADSLYSKTHDATLTTISLQLPLFRTMLQALSGLETRVTALESAQKQMKVQITALTQRLAELEEKVERARKEAYEAKLAAEAASAAAAATRASAISMWSAVDPLVFAVPKGTKLSDETAALVGPAWGPDFPDALLEVCGLSVVKNQRKKLSAQ